MKIIITCGAALASLLFIPRAFSDYQVEQVAFDWRYESAFDEKNYEGKGSVAFKDSLMTDPGIQKSISAVELANAMKEGMKAFHDCNDTFEPPIFFDATAGVPSICPLDGCGIPPVSRCENVRKAAAQNLRGKIAGIEKDIFGSDFFGSKGGLEDFARALDVAKRLVTNMETNATVVIFNGPFGESFDMAGGAMGGAALSAPASGGLTVTAGGAQNYAYVKKMINDGQVPMSENLAIEGFLSEMTFPLADGACKQLLCVHGATYLENQKDLYLQLSMNSSMGPKDFQRKPLKLSVVLDISGSMSATDYTMQTRLEWAKQSLVKVVQELKEGDVLGIVLFDTQSQIMRPMAQIDGKDQLIAQINAIQTAGSTNLEAGLRDGYEQVSDVFQDGYENRVLLISDAGLNTGVTDLSTILRLVSDYAGEGIGLTAVGLGENFNQDFIHAITMSKGGNYLFVQSGEEMYGFIQAFDYLVTPVAYNFKLHYALEGYELVEAYGVPKNPADPVRPLVDIRSLFFSNSGGVILMQFKKI